MSIAPSSAAQVQQGALLVCIQCFTEMSLPQDSKIGLAPGAVQEMLDFSLGDE